MRGVVAICGCLVLGLGIALADEVDGRPLPSWAAFLTVRTNGEEVCQVGPPGFKVSGRDTLPCVEALETAARLARWEWRINRKPRRP